MRKLFIVLTGPTAVGKTETSLLLSTQISVEIINCDVGQFYKPLSIGTAKPDWANEKTKHHMFDIIKEPRIFSVAKYRKSARDKMEKIWQKNKIPLLVGGSLFYINALFFPPLKPENKKDKAKKFFPKKTNTEELWKKLNKIDPERASKIDKNDRYRLKRALEIWASQGVIPSSIKPKFDPISNFHIIFLLREREELYHRINERTKVMMKEGWIGEVEELPLKWKNYLLKKKLIGYPEIINFLDSDQSSEALEYLIKTVQKNTRNYAKRQITFWQALKKRLTRAILEKRKIDNSFYGEVGELNLTLHSVGLYIDQVIKQFRKEGFLG